MTPPLYLEHPEWFVEGLPGLSWRPDGKEVSWLEVPTSQNKNADLVGIDLAGKKRKILSGDLLKVADGDTMVNLPLSGYRWLPGGDGILVSFKNDLYTISIPQARVSRLTRSPERPKKRLSFSPDGKKLAWTTSDHVWMVELATPAERRLTAEAPAGVFQGDLDWMYDEELAIPLGKVLVWSPDSNLLAWMCVDDRKVPTWPVVNLSTWPTSLQQQAYPHPGETLPSARVVVSDLQGKVLVETPWVEDAYLAPMLSWTVDSTRVAVTHLDRLQENLRIELWPTDGGLPRTLLEEKGEPWVNLLAPVLFLKDGESFVWMSQRDNFARPYRGQMGGQAGLKALVDVPWDLTLEAVSEDGRQLWFTGSGDEVTEQHLWHLPSGGGELLRVTWQWGWHEVLMAPRGEGFVDTFSDLKTPAELTLWKNRRDKVVVLKHAHPELLRHDPGSAEKVNLKAEDGTPLKAILYKPPGFDPNLHYPAVVVVYGGPHFQIAKDRYAFWGYIGPLLADGFVVWTLDNRGSGNRGRNFEAPLDREMGKTELADQLVGVQHLKSLPFVDAGRVGIMGKSYGGYMTLYALTHSDAFKAGISMAPVSTWERYDAAYTERYMHTPATNPEGYKKASTLDVSNLKVPLLLVHGGVDDNVHLSNIGGFVQACAAQGFIPPLLLFPEADHGVNHMSGPPRDALTRAVLAFFEKELGKAQKAEP